MIIRVFSERTDGNCYIVQEGDRAVVIDPAESEIVSNQLETRTLTPEYIILTHEHFDHIMGLEDLRNAYGIPVIASTACSNNIQTVKGNLSNISGILEYFRTGCVPEETIEPFVCQKAEITFDDQYEFTWRGHTFSFIRIPGHSQGSVMITLDGESVFTGDYLIQGREVITRLKGGNTEDYEKTACPVLESIPEGVHIYPGHEGDYVKGEET